MTLVMRGGDEPQRIEVDLGGATALDLLVEDAGDGPACDHADWAEAKIATSAGNTLWRDEARWIASQYHRPDLGRGMILAFRHAASPDRTKVLSLHGLRPEATYELSCHADGSKAVATGAELTAGLSVTIREPGQSECVVYREVKD